ncbi:MAG: hypothetical protein GX568_02120 [Candidatus Gastranaerophilales bacterium]|jgi:hypothetical protein|nr:hypothetical protein [Candidatus Gastranaerophilales bacterium]
MFNFNIKKQNKLPLPTGSVADVKAYDTSYSKVVMMCCCMMRMRSAGYFCCDM